MQSELTFYRDPAVALQGTTPSGTWKMPGMALSASSVRIYPGQPVLQAIWYLIWTPNAGVAYNAVRLVTCDNGPTNFDQIAFISKNQTMTPVVDSYNITDAVNEIIASGASRQIIMQTCGDSASNIYRSTIDLVWE